MRLLLCMWLQRSRRGKDCGLWVDMLLIEGSGACGLGWIVKDCLSSVYDGGSGGRCGSYERIRVDRLVKREVG